MLDKLRVCIICNYYSQNGRLNSNEYMNHPAVCNLKCEHLDSVIGEAIAHRQSRSFRNIANGPIKHGIGDDSKPLSESENEFEPTKSFSEMDSGEKILLKEDLNHNEYLNHFQEQFSLKICVGNVSKSLSCANGKHFASLLNTKSNQALLASEDDSVENSVESSQYNQDLITHKWMIYIRSPNCAKLENYIKKVVFYLHFSYKPYDLVEVK